MARGFKPSARLGTRLISDFKRRANVALRAAAVEVLNDLTDISPAWSGDFRNSWYVESSDGTRAARNPGDEFFGASEYGYNLFNVPNIKESKGPIKLSIGNSAPYATIAMDLEGSQEGFEYPGYEPIKKLEDPSAVQRGTRESAVRGDITLGKGSNRRTAPLDWYTTYMEAGGFDKSFKNGCKLGFKRRGAGGVTPADRPITGGNST